MAKPRVLFVSRTRYDLPLSASLAQKWDALERELDLRVLASAARHPARSGSFVLVGSAGRLSGAAFWLLLPWRIFRLVRDFDPDAIVAQSPFEAAAALLARRVSGSRARTIVEVQGDWRTATRLYGSRLRAALSPLADAIAAGALRRADAVRTISPYTTRIVRELGVEPTATFPTFVDLRAFTDPAPVEPPSRPEALFVGVLEPYKNIDGLASAWLNVIEQLPAARLHIVGKGTRESVVRSLVDASGSSVRWTRELDADGVARALDAATLLVLPSRSEGMGRVVIESFCRSRPVIGTSVGGIPDLVVDGGNGVLVEPGSTVALATALVQLLGDRELTLRLGASARASAERWLQTPGEFAVRTRSLVEPDISASSQSVRP
jgi:glycosyltransferase involved in cell wall biosynthesis